MPSLEVTAFGRTLLPNPFFGGALFPAVCFGLLYLWPWIERRVTGDRRRHDLLDRPRDAPWRTALGAAFFSWVVMIFVAGAGDRMFFSVGFPYGGQVWFFRIAAFVVPVVVFLVVRRVCEELRATDAHPLRGWSGTEVRRSAAGGFEEVRRTR